MHLKVSYFHPIEPFRVQTREQHHKLPILKEDRRHIDLTRGLSTRYTWLTALVKHKA